jgi:hypothetical protein
MTTMATDEAIDTQHNLDQSGSLPELVELNGRGEDNYHRVEHLGGMSTNQTANTRSNADCLRSQPESIELTRRVSGNILEQFKDLGGRVLKSLQGFLALILSIAIFGAQTFNDLVGQLGQPSTFSENTVRVFLAISWLLFLLALATSIFAAVIIDPYVAEIGTADLRRAEPDTLELGTVEADPGEPETVEPTSSQTQRTATRATNDTKMYHKIGAVGVVMAAEFLLLTAFVFMSLVVIAYAKVVGYVALGLCALTGLLIVYAWKIKLTRPGVSQHIAMESYLDVRARI